MIGPEVPELVQMASAAVDITEGFELSLRTEDGRGRQTTERRLPDRHKRSKTRFWDDHPLECRGSTDVVSSTNVGACVGA